MLYRLVTRQTRDRQEVARLLGVHRNTIGRWLPLYAAGGLAGDLTRTTSNSSSICSRRPFPTVLICCSWTTAGPTRPNGSRCRTTCASCSCRPMVQSCTRLSGSGATSKTRSPGSNSRLWRPTKTISRAPPGPRGSDAASPHGLHLERFSASCKA
jgi:hypothetical protein